MTLPPDPIQQQPTYDLAKAAFEAQPSIRVLFDNGAGNSNAGWPYPGFERSFSSFPIPGTTARSWYLAPDGALADAPATGSRADAFTWDADARPLTDFTGDTGAGEDGLWTATPRYQWTQDPGRSAVAYVTAPLSDDTTVVGAGRVDLWVRSSEPNVDLQATISEVRPDGKETFVQNGWVRTKTCASSTRPRARSSSRCSACARRTSRRCPPTTSCPSRSRSITRGTCIARARASASGSPRRTATSRSGRSARPSPPERRRSRSATADGMPSRLVLPQVPGVNVPTRLPPCPGLRGEPCRDYVPFVNASYSLNSYPRPGGGTPLRVPLVPEFNQCTSPDATHVGPLASGSCRSPALASQLLTTSTTGKGSASARLDVRPGNPATPEDEADVSIAASATDVRSAPGGGDYSGQTVLSTGIRMTDLANGPGENEAATVKDFDLGIPVGCSPTPDPLMGSTCTVTTSADTLVPGFAREGDRAVMSAFSLRLLDAGPDGDIDPASGGLGCPPTCGSGDEATFLRQGLFTP